MNKIDLTCADQFVIFNLKNQSKIKVFRIFKSTTRVKIDILNPYTALKLIDIYLNIILWATTRVLIEKKHYYTILERYYRGSTGGCTYVNYTVKPLHDHNLKF